MRALLAIVIAVAAVLSCNAQKTTTRFAWGAEAGASIDLTGSEMSSIDFNANFGLSHGWIKFLGVGAQADFMVSNSCRSYPLFVEFQTNFVNRPSLLFWDLKLGASLNYLEHNHQQTGTYGSTGIGVNLATGSNFRSHLLIAYSFRQRRPIVGPEMTHNFKDLHCASVKIGVSF